MSISAPASKTTPVLLANPPVSEYLPDYLLRIYGIMSKLNYTENAIQAELGIFLYCPSSL